MKPILKLTAYYIEAYHNNAYYLFFSIDSYPRSETSIFTFPCVFSCDNVFWAFYYTYIENQIGKNLSYWNNYVFCFFCPYVFYDAFSCVWRSVSFPCGDLFFFCAYGYVNLMNHLSYFLCCWIYLKRYFMYVLFRVRCMVLIYCQPFLHQWYWGFLYPYLTYLLIYLNDLLIGFNKIINFEFQISYKLDWKNLFLIFNNNWKNTKVI